MRVLVRMGGKCPEGGDAGHLFGFLGLSNCFACAVLHSTPLGFADIGTQNEVLIHYFTTCHIRREVNGTLLEPRPVPLTVSGSMGAVREAIDTQRTLMGVSRV